MELRALFPLLLVTVCVSSVLSFQLTSKLVPGKQIRVKAATMIRKVGLFQHFSTPVDSDSNRQEDMSPFVASPDSKPEGYMSSDLTSMEDGKQFRVLAYILIALLPCLLLVPFFLSRDFVPPTDPAAYQ
jgi:hypothetical protein